MSREILQEAISLIPGGMRRVAAETGRSYEAVRKWTKNGLPRTEWTGETDYCKTIENLQGKYSADQLLGRPGDQAA